MSNTDKTRQKLVNSMRKSKDAAAGKPAPRKGSAKTGSSVAAGTQAKPRKTASTATATASTADRGAVAKPAAATGRPRQAVADPYQSSGRVWPD